MPVTYTSESALRNPLALFRLMLIELSKSQELAWRLLIRDLKAQYKQTIFGFLWVLFPPIANSFLLFFVATKSPKVDFASQNPLPIVLPILVGSVFWQLFIDCLMNPLRLVESNKHLIAKVSFPRESIILSAIGQSLVNFSVRLIILIGACLYFTTNPTLLFWISLAPIAMTICTFGTALGIFLIPFGLLYKDVSQGLGIITMILLFITPVGFQTSLNPSSVWYLKYNPLAYLINLPKDIFCNVYPEYWLIVVFIGASSITALFTSWMMMRLSLPIVFERLGA
jgi:lipopolysaccharide transport system permease protein